jgi:hypothetical protein
MIAIGMCIISVLLVVIVLFLRKILYAINGGVLNLKKELENFWVTSANVTSALEQMTESIDQYRKDFKLTFDDKFAKRVEEIVGLGMPPKDTMKVKCMDGEEHTVTIDHGW